MPPLLSVFVIRHTPHGRRLWIARMGQLGEVPLTPWLPSIVRPEECKTSTPPIKGSIGPSEVGQRVLIVAERAAAESRVFVPLREPGEEGASVRQPVAGAPAPVRGVHDVHAVKSGLSSPGAQWTFRVHLARWQPLRSALTQALQ